MNDLIKTALSKGQTTLSEYESKKFLSAHNIPVTREYLAKTQSDALEFAGVINGPVALKACVPDLMHKSESGGVKLNLLGDEAIKNAYRSLKDAFSRKLDGILVQETIEGDRELVLGLTRDPQFGPSVMVGMGGIMTEVIDDVVFRVVSLDAVSRTVVTLGDIGMANGEISEIDINPFIVSADGVVTAVDALIVFDSRRDRHGQGTGGVFPG